MSGHIPPTFIRELISRIDIVDIVSARVSLVQHTDNYLGICPFHSEKTPSFTVTESKQFYHCFGCGAHGNAIDFIMAFDHLEFVETIEYLSAQIGVDIPYETKDGQKAEKTQDYKALYECMEKASAFYQSRLKQSDKAIAYFKERGLTGLIAKAFSLGYALDGWDALLTQLGSDDEEKAHLEKVGLILKKDRGGFYDRFRDRLMFPIHDARGRVVAFGGRAFGDEKPKYLNSPETVIFHKSQELYGLYQARQKQSKFEQLLVVEGYMDVIALHQHGIYYAIASLGTAFNGKHVQKLLRYTNKIVFCFDGDDAGRGAAERAMKVVLPLMREGISMHFMFLPKNEDPDSLIRRIGQDAFEKKISTSIALSDFFFDLLKTKCPIKTIDDRARFAKLAIDELKMMPKGLFHQFMREQLASILKVDVNALDKMRINQKTRPPQMTNPLSEVQLGRIMAPIHQVIACLLSCPDLVNCLEDEAFLAYLNFPEAPLLLKLLELYKNDNQLTIGALLGNDELSDFKSLIATLANWKPAIKADLKLIFLGAIRQLKVQQIKALRLKLIAKSKTTHLNDQERQLLQRLLKEEMI